MIFEEEISLSVAFISLVPIVLYIITEDLNQLKALIGLIGTIIVNESIKYFVIKERSPRPIGAKNCNLCGDGGNQEGKPGMPSGHSAQIGFFAGYYFQQTDNIWIRLLLIIYAILVMISRYTKKCHTVYQILTGGMLGTVMSILTVRYL